MSARSFVKAIMRAIRVTEFGSPEVLKLETNVSVPKPSNDQVLIKVHAAGINPVDTYIRSGTYAAKPTLPYTPGKDVAGVVEDVGSNVRHLKKGDRVYTMSATSGGYAEYCTAASADTKLLHSNLTYEQGAGIGVPYYTAYRALMIVGRAKPGETVLIHGASGAVGLACVQIAHSRGLRVLGTAGSQAGLDLITRNGCDAVFCHRDEGYATKIMEATSSIGPHIIIEMLANVNLERDLTMIAKKGRIVVVGNRGSVEITPRLAMQKECIVTGMLLFNASQGEMDEIDAAVAAGMRDGWIKPHIGKVYTLDQAPTAHEDVINNKGAQGRLIFKVSS
ncbi:quinone oxidoreductase-like [Saccostrea echinata]|uniref:quinone oxidoreductase-like n=1 Tax=Saccostrea echinata TaxID=191078 RepID=UPI002A82F733|nr:quinone oxidoreductase-like [Saccostrea echinata]XP_061184089.1 quinone oxidoreductase-like [Saccostrea echinata]